MRTRSSLAERTRTAIEPWLPIDSWQLALLTLVIMGALVIGPFVH